MKQKHEIPILYMTLNGTLTHESSDDPLHAEGAKGSRKTLSHWLLVGYMGIRSLYNPHIVYSVIPC